MPVLESFSRPYTLSVVNIYDLFILLFSFLLNLCIVLNMALNGRLVAVVWPAKYKRLMQAKVVKVYLALLWFYSALLWLPLTFGVGFHKGMPFVEHYALNHSIYIDQIAITTVRIPLPFSSRRQYSFSALADFEKVNLDISIFPSRLLPGYNSCGHNRLCSFSNNKFHFILSLICVLE